MKWNSFSEEEFTSAIMKYNNSSTPSLDKLLWKYLKKYIKDIAYHILESSLILLMYALN